MRNFVSFTQSFRTYVFFSFLVNISPTTKLLTVWNTLLWHAFHLVLTDLLPPIFFAGTYLMPPEEKHYNFFSFPVHVLWDKWVLFKWSLVSVCTEIGLSLGMCFGEICSCPSLVSRNKFHQTTYPASSAVIRLLLSMSKESKIGHNVYLLLKKLECFLIDSNEYFLNGLWCLYEQRLAKVLVRVLVKFFPAPVVDGPFLAIFGRHSLLIASVYEHLRARTSIYRAETKSLYVLVWINKLSVSIIYPCSSR